MVRQLVADGPAIPTVAVYAGDFDPSGTDIERDFSKRAGMSFDRIVQGDGFPGTCLRGTGGTAGPGRTGSVAVGRAARPLPDAIERYWDADAYKAALAREAADRDRL